MQILKMSGIFFQKYSAITQSYLSGISWYPDKKVHTHKNFFLSNQVNQLYAIQASIHASEKLINKDQIVSIEIYEVTEKIDCDGEMF